MATLLKINELDEPIVGFLEWKSPFSYYSFLLLKHLELNSVNVYRWGCCNVFRAQLAHPAGDVVGPRASSGFMFLWTHVGIYFCVVQLMYLSIIIYISMAVYFCIC